MNCRSEEEEIREIRATPLHLLKIGRNQTVGKWKIIHGVAFSEEYEMITEREF